jgi:hypothetical protein
VREVPAVPRRVFDSLIQASFGNLEAVVVDDESLWHWFRDHTAPRRRWTRRETVVSGGVVGPGALIESSFSSDTFGNFEVAVPIRAGSDVELAHFWRPSSAGGNWSHARLLLH